MDSTELLRAIELVFAEYEYKRVEELIGTAKGATRIKQQDIPVVLGKAQAGRELKAQLLTHLGLAYM